MGEEELDQAARRRHARNQRLPTRLREDERTCPDVDEELDPDEDRHRDGDADDGNVAAE